MTRKCPLCNLVYTDEEIVFCEQDGTVLLNLHQSEKTKVIPPPINSAPTLQMQETLPIENKKTGFNYTYLIILVLAILLTGSIVALVYEKEKDPIIQTGNQIEVSQAPNQDNQPQVSANPTTEQPQINSEESRFFITDCRSIKDNQTNLEWFVGPNQNMTWFEAQQWTASLRVCGNDWRMPTMQEIGTLYNPNWKAGRGYFTNGKYFPAHIHPIFSEIGDGSWVWSNQQNGSDARSFNLNQGKAVEFSAMNTTYSTRAFAVKK